MIDHTIKNSFCENCEASLKVKNPCIVGRGILASKVLVLGECPGKAEDELNGVFIGKSGKFLDYMIQYTGLSCFISYAVRCRSVDKSFRSKIPTPTEIESCRPFTIDLIRMIKPAVIITLGKVALHQLISVNAGIPAIRGKKLYHPDLGATIIPTYDPSYVLEQKDKMYNDDFYKDLILAKEVSNCPPTRTIKSIPKSLRALDEIDEYLRKACDTEAVAIDIETTSLNAKDGKITDISFCYEIGSGVHIEWDLLMKSESTVTILRRLLVSDVIKVFHNANFDIQFLRAFSFDVKKPIFDTMLAYHTMTMQFKGGGTSSLYRLKIMTYFLTSEGGYDTVLDEYGGIRGIQQIQSTVAIDKKERHTLFDEHEIEELLGIDKALDTRLVKRSREINEAKKARLRELKLGPKEFYAAMDSDVTFRIYKYLKIIIDRDYSFPFYNIIMPLNYALLRIHENGIKIDTEYIETIVEYNNKVVEEIQEEFFSKVPGITSLRSTEQLRIAMYEKLGAEKNKMFLTKKGKLPSTDEKAIKFFSKKIPVLKLILKYRELEKQTGTYLKGYKDIADENHRVYPSYLQIGTITGRLSSTKPNLQNVPRDNRIRNMIIPEKGHKFVIVDLSQVELRVLAMMSGDQEMIKAFESGHDFHMYTACIMFDIPLDKFDKENKKHDEKRSAAKSVNFGMVYQQRAETMAANLGISVEKAVEFHHKFFKAYPKVAEWVVFIKRFVRQYGYVETLYGRRRYIPHIYSSNKSTRAEAERQAVNTPIQGSAGDICFYGLIRFQDWLDENNKKTKIVGTVHDSILAEVPFGDCSEIDEICEILPKLMTENIPRITIPLKADIDVLEKWEK